MRATGMSPRRGTVTNAEGPARFRSLESVVERERMRNGVPRPSRLAHAEGLREILARHGRLRPPFTAGR